MSTPLPVQLSILSLLVALPSVVNAQHEPTQPSKPSISAGAIEAELLANRAASMLASGRLNEARALALRAIDELDNGSSRGSHLLVPLYVLASIDLEEWHLSKAFSTFQQMKALPLANAHESALLHGLGGTLAQVTGNLDRAREEYGQAAAGLQSAGMQNSAEMASIDLSLAALSLNQRHPAKAMGEIEYAATILATAPDTVCADRVKLLNLRAVIQARRGKWVEAQADLESALWLAHGDVVTDNTEVVLAGRNYIEVCRRLHRRPNNQLAGWIDAIHPSSETNGSVIDVSELQQR